MTKPAQESGSHTDYRAEFKRGSGRWHPYHGTVRRNGHLAPAGWCSASIENMLEAIDQWDPEGESEWRIIERRTSWTETTIYRKDAKP